MANKVTIDAGHGGSDPGAVGNNLRECDINLAIALKVKPHLTRHGVSVQMTRLTDRTVSLQERSSMANEWGADAFVSIHCNSVNFNAYGIETFAYKPQYRKLADSVHGSLVADESLYYTNRGVKFADFHVLRETSMDAALIETAFISNQFDATLLKNKQEEFAVAIAKGILNHLGIAWVEPKPPATGNTTYYRCITGSYSSKANAEKRVKELKAKGFDSFIDVYKK